jgi:3-mercaptopyruvate sulfurtransferase SseA
LPAVSAIAPSALKERMSGAGKPLVLNVGVSKIHRKGHVPEAVWVTRGYLERAKAAYPDAREVVITSDSKEHACFATADAALLWPGASVVMLEGGTPAWRAADLPLEEGMSNALCAEDDVWYKPYTDINAKPEAMQGYFDWEFGLVERIKKDGCVSFALMR